MNAHGVICLAAWGGGCYGLGVLTGVLIQHHRFTREVTMQAREAWRTIRDAGLGTLLMAVALVLVGVQLFVGQRQHNEDTAKVARVAAAAADSAAQVKQLGQCVATYANRLSGSLAPRQHAAEQLQAADQRFNAAIVRLLTDALVTHPDPSRNKADAERLKAAAQHKADVAAHLNEERVRKPYPAPPKDVCPQ